MIIGNDPLSKLANYIELELRSEFKDKCLSGNLRDTIKVEQGIDGEIIIKIPAEKYDLNEWSKNRVIKHTGGSYATSVDEKGGFSKKHKDFVQRSIDKAYVKWKKEISEKYDSIERTDS